MAKKTSLPVYVVAFCLFLGGVGYMAWTGFSENNVYFLTVSEALDMPGQELKAARLFGTVSGEDLTAPATGWESASVCLMQQSPARNSGWNIRAWYPTPSNPVRK